MKKKPYELGILVGRFQTVHLGHADMIGKATELCRRVGVFIGSSQESGTNKNPFSYETREAMLREMFGDAIEIYPLPDIGVGNNSTWGEYVLKNVRERFGRPPDLLISGKEARRVDWFDGVEGASIAELYVPKTVDISASRMRDFFLRDDKEAWMSYTAPALRHRYEELRDAVCASADNLETKSM